MWPTTNPCVPPEKRPSVISATSLPRPSPMMALVGASISLMPGPPRGPSKRMTTTSPAWMPPSSIFSRACSSELKTRADDLLRLRVGLHMGEIFGERFSRDREAIAVQEAGVEQGFHHRLDSADG